MSIELRPHHGLCIGFFAGKGYSTDFVRNMRQVIERMQAEDPEITLVCHTDVICRCCPENRGGCCTSQTKVLCYDRSVLELCGLPEGSVLHWESFAALVRSRILSVGLLSAVCGDCQWFGICGKAETGG